jgi:uncharacterized Zn finger protein
MTELFGVTPWGRDWVRLAQPTAIARPNPALPKARSLARNDRVEELNLTLGGITATVTDKAVRRVRLGLAPWTAAQLAEAQEMLKACPEADLPDSLHAEMSRRGLAPVPRVDELTTECDCPQRARPCVHTLAVFFEVARRVDESPRLSLVPRGVDGARGTAGSHIRLSDIERSTFYG